MYINLHSCHYVIAFSQEEKSSSPFHGKKEEQHAAVSDQNDPGRICILVLVRFSPTLLPTTSPSLCDKTHKDSHPKYKEHTGPF